MNEPKPCCRSLDQSGRSRSPFDEVIAFGYDDGPTEGMIRCGGCGREYRFQMLDSRPGSPDDEDERIFGLSRLPEGSMSNFRAAMSPYQPSHGPFWVPLWSFPSEQERDAMNALVDRLYELAGPVELVIASSGRLDGEILTSRPIAPAELGQSQDWFSTLGLVKTAVGD